MIGEIDSGDEAAFASDAVEVAYGLEEFDWAEDEDIVWDMNHAWGFNFKFV